MGWFHSSHEPPRPIAQATATGEVVNYIKFCEAIDRVQPKPWLLLIVDDVDGGSSRQTMFFVVFFWKLSVTRWRLGLFVSDGWGEVLETHTHTQFLPLLQRKWYVTWPKISDLEAIGIHTHDSHPVKIRLVIWQFSGWKFAPRSSLVRETGSTFQKSMLGYCNHHDTQLVNMPWWRFDRKLLQESLLWIRFLQKKAGTTQLKASKFDTLLRHISIEHISIECGHAFDAMPPKGKAKVPGSVELISSCFDAEFRVFSTSWGKL